MDFTNKTAYETGVPKKIPNRGLGYWTFPCKNLDAVFARAKVKSASILSPPVLIDSPFFGKRLAMTRLAPNGFQVEFFQN